MLLERFLQQAAKWAERASGWAGGSGGAGTGGEEKSGVESGEEETSSSTTHERLSQLPSDPRVFRAMLLSIKASPALYRAILSHSIIQGRAPSKATGSGSGKGGGGSGGSGKSSKKKRREKEKEKEGEAAEAASRKELPSQLQLPAVQQSEPLPPPLLHEQTSVFVAKAVADRSLQALLIAAKVVLSTYLVAGDGKSPQMGMGPTPSVSGGVETEQALASGGLPLPKLSVGSLLALLFPRGSTSNPFEQARKKAEEAA